MGGLVTGFHLRQVELRGVPWFASFARGPDGGMFFLFQRFLVCVVFLKRFFSVLTFCFEDFKGYFMGLPWFSQYFCVCLFFVGVCSCFRGFLLVSGVVFLVV